MLHTLEQGHLRGEQPGKVLIHVVDEDYVTVREAGELLGVSKVKMSHLLRDGVLATQESILDKRVKLIRRDTVEQLAKTLRPRRHQGGEA